MNLAAYFEAVGLPRPVLEHRFHPLRKWRFDCAWPSRLVALEVEGGSWKGGRHTRGKGFVADIQKYNAATLMGWRLFRATWEMVNSGETLALLEKVLK